MCRQGWLGAGGVSRPRRESCIGSIGHLDRKHDTWCILGKPETDKIFVCPA